MFLVIMRRKKLFELLNTTGENCFRLGKMWGEADKPKRAAIINQIIKNNVNDILLKKRIKGGK